MQIANCINEIMLNFFFNGHHYCSSLSPYLPLHISVPHHGTHVLPSLAPPATTSLHHCSLHVQAARAVSVPHVMRHLSLQRPPLLDPMQHNLSLLSAKRPSWRWNITASTMPPLSACCRPNATVA